MRLYHGSNCRISKVDLSFSRRYMDFGPGFYLTPDFQRAITMANRAVALNGNGNPEINPFIFNKSCVPKICRYWNLSHAVGIGHLSLYRIETNL